MSEWKEYILEDVINKFIDYRGKTPTKTTKGVPLVTAKIVKNGRLIEPTEFIAESDYESWMTRGFPEINDIVLTTEAPLGEVALIKNKNVALAQRIITLQTKKGICNSIFLKYFLESSEGQFALQSRSSGSTVEGIKSAELKKMIISLPILSEQIAIASILSSLDDKIDLFHRQNKTLEQLAETLFRQWFAEEAEESWEVVKVGKYIKTNKSSISKNYPFTEIEYLDTSSLTEGIISDTQILSLKDAPSRAKRLVQNGDILISTVRPDQKHYGIVYNPKENLVVSTGFCVITCIAINPHFVYLLLTSDEMTQFLHSIAEGSTSTYPSLKPSDIEEIEFLIPPIEKLRNFGTLAFDYWKKINSNQTQIRTLTQTRDTLLPKLMSGEVRVEI